MQTPGGHVTLLVSLFEGTALVVATQTGTMGTVYVGQGEQDMRTVLGKRDDPLLGEK